jgi:hypothetical protein
MSLAEIVNKNESVLFIVLKRLLRKNCTSEISHRKRYERNKPV